MTQQHVFTLSRLATPIGTALFASDTAGRLRVFDWESHTARMHRLLGRLYGANGVKLVEQPASGQLRDRLEAFFAGDIGAIDGIETATAGTPFQRIVWAALRQIPPGQSWSYGKLAVHIGQPTAARAVGLANGANPIGVVVPCHRVIGAGGALTGYGGGLDRKAWLLHHEASRVAMAA